jgi:membrane protein DedA with SNARE-associated domain
VVSGIDLGAVSPIAAYGVLFALIAIESGGIPLPGESALAIAGIAAARGHLSIVIVIAVAAGAAIVGDNAGFLAGRRYGKRIWLWGRVWRKRRERWLEEANGFIDEWGTTAVVVGRWVTVARYTVAWLAGINRMSWRRFFLANAAGGISWAVTIGLAAYWLGTVAKTGFEAFGAIGLVLLLVALAGHRLWRRRRRAEAAS